VLWLFNQLEGGYFEFGMLSSYLFPIPDGWINPGPVNSLLNFGRRNHAKPPQLAPNKKEAQTAAASQKAR